MNRRGILLLGALSLISIAGYLYFIQNVDGWGFPLDDSWIHQTYARNLAGGEGWAFFPGKSSAGSTSPLWVLLLVPGVWFGLAPFAWTYLLGWLCLWALALAGWGLMTEMLPEKPGWALGGAGLLVFEWHLVWAAISGMETLLFAVFVTGIFLALLRIVRDPEPNRWLNLGIFIGLSAWIRPEGILLFFPVLMTLLFIKQRMGVHGSFISGVGISFLPYLAFNMLLAGSWWPNTFYAKQAEYAILRDAPFLSRLGGQIGLLLVGVGLLLLPFYLAKMWGGWRTRRWAELAGGGWVVAHLALYALRLPVTYQHGRYLIPVIPLFIIWGMAGLGDLLSVGHQKSIIRMASRAWFVAVPLLAVGFWIIGARTAGQDVAVINTEMIATAEWVTQNTAQNTLIAAHDIGALGYFSGRPLVDLAGLVSPEVIPVIRDESALRAFLDEKRPELLITFPGWYPQLTQGLTLAYQTEGQYSPALGGENMAVYRWNAP